ncbi:MAG: Ig-like domain-containing protein [Bacteroidaceae bacterium]|nr:Ig-like domain-containing protein [Bacteroidaceae bacterium]
MKRNTLRHFLTCSIAAALLFLGYTPASAQYYMNVLKKNGETVRFEVTELDSVSFTSTEVPAYEYVDLGLSVNWATFNVGATKPEEYGDYYAWGETEQKDNYTWSTYKWCNGSSYTITKYCNDSSYGIGGFTDNLTVLVPEDDVAHVKWGGSWRMPTEAEQDELRNYCTWRWYDSGNTEFNGVAGYKVTSNIEGYTDHYIFLPAAGSRIGANLFSVGNYGNYWSSSLNTRSPYNAWNIGLVSGSVYGSRYNGQSVRPVCPSETWSDNISVTIDRESAALHVGEVVSLTATVKKGNYVVDHTVTWTSDEPEIASVTAKGVVTAKAVGKAMITATVQSKSATCVIEVTAAPSGNYEYVDLGLSVNWATFNVGASNPEGSGVFYAWGETEPKNDYSWTSYKWCNGSYKSLTKYNTDSYYGTVDNKTVLDPEDDVAHVKWGGSWRIPTKEEQNELRNNCTWTWYDSGNTEFNGVAGYKVTSNIDGYTGRYIFLPAAGSRDGTDLLSVGYYGNCWSSSLYTDRPGSAYGLSFDSGRRSAGTSSRYYGHSVRPVCPSETWSDDISVTIDQESATLHVGETISLTATVRKGNNVISYPVTWTSDKPEFASVDAEGVVTAKAVGSAKITVSVQGKFATFIIEVTAVPSGGYEYVDLGLSVKWATFNVGATKPEEYGDCFAWGETEPKDDYSWSTYKFRTSGDYERNVEFSKYNTSSNNGTVDNKIVLDPEDDVAHVKWGGNWRMPTRKEQNELLNNCIWTWYDSDNTEFGGVAGYKVTSNVPGYTDRFIFLPAAGFRYGTILDRVGDYGDFWSSSLNSDYPFDAHSLLFDSDLVGWYYDGGRYYGRSVRPVCP